MSGESAGERWSPVQRVESVLLSIISLLDDAECSSPANVDAGVLLRKEPEQYAERVRADVEASRADIPDGFEMPTSAAKEKVVVAPEKEDRDFWVDSDDEHGFGGSDTDEWAGGDGEGEDEDEDEEMADSDAEEDGGEDEAEE